MNTTGRPKIIAFYAYKGGTGRSFALAHTAWALAREGRRLVVIDLDLSAPSLWALFGKQPAVGVIEYLRQWSSRNPLAVREIIEEVVLDQKASGALYLLQAGRLDELYLQTLQTLDWHALLRLPTLRAPASDRFLFKLSTPFEDLFDELIEDLRPDAILLDAPTGFNDTSSLCLRVLADLVIAIFAPTKVQLDGIAKVVSLLTNEQLARSQRDGIPRPDVYCVASTILLSRLAGAHVGRIRDAFDYLSRVRYEAVGTPLNLEGETQDLVQQELAVITYDERLADTEILPTSDEPRPSYFSAFQDLIAYVQGSLPAPVAYATLSPRDKPALLDDLEPCYGLFAEQEVAKLLESFFLRTRHLREVKDARVALVLGGKGSGKTALFSYITARQTGRDMDTIAVHGPSSGINPDLLCSIQDGTNHMDVFWRLYLLSAVNDGPLIEDKQITTAVDTLCHLPQDPSRLGLLLGYLNAPNIAAPLNRAWHTVNEHLKRNDRRIALCLDKLDVAFKADVERRERGLVDLFVAWQATFSQLSHVTMKIFLRTDLWQRLSFPEKSHLKGREMRLAWESGDLWRLVIKRALAAPRFKEWCGRSLPLAILSEDAVETAGERDLYPYLDRLFEHHIWAGKNSLSRNWILRRLADAKSAIYPRDLICLAQDALRIERTRLQESRRLSDSSVISRESLSDSLTPTSRQRLDAVREEYPELRDVLDKLKGLVATGDLISLKNRLLDKDIEVLSEAGVIRLENGNYLVPDLYRHGLEMPRPGPR